MDRKSELTITLNHVVLAHGFAKLSMAELAKKSHISRATLYLYFANKQEIISAVVDRHLAYIAAQQPTPNDYSVKSYQRLRLNLLLLLGSMSDLFLTDLHKMYPNLAIQVEQAYRSYYQQTATEIEHFQSVGIVRQSLDASLIVTQDDVLITGVLQRVRQGELPFEQTSLLLKNYFSIQVLGSVAAEYVPQVDLTQSKAFIHKILNELYSTYYS